MNLTVEWVSKNSLYKEPWKDLQEIPVIRVATLRGWLRAERNTAIDLYTDEARQIFDDILSQLPEEGQ